MSDLIEQGLIKGFNFADTIDDIPEEKKLNSINFIKSSSTEFITTPQLNVALETKVDKVVGKELSENDYTNEDKLKVDIIDIDGDGTKYLADDGSYKEISIQSRIQNANNSSYFEAGGNVSNEVKDTEQGTIQTQFKTETNQGHFDITNSKSILGGYSKNDDDGENFGVQILSGAFPSGTVVQKFVMSENRTNEDEVAKISDIPKIVSAENVVVAVEDWVEDSTYEDYNYKADLTLVGMLETYEPSVVFGLTEIESGNYASVCLAGSGTITIYSRELPSESITLPLIKGEEL